VKGALGACEERLAREEGGRRSAEEALGEARKEIEGLKAKLREVGAAAKGLREPHREQVQAGLASGGMQEREQVRDDVGDDRRLLAEETKARRRAEGSLRAERLKRLAAESAMLDIAKLFQCR